MGAIGVVTCPVCGESYLCADENVQERERLKSLTRAHLRDHDLPEAKVGIYGVQMADEHSRLQAAPDAVADRGLGTWLEREVGAGEEAITSIDGGPTAGG